MVLAWHMDEQRSNQSSKRYLNFREGNCNLRPDFSFNEQRGTCGDIVFFGDTSLDRWMMATACFFLLSFLCQFSYSPCLLKSLLLRGTPKGGSSLYSHKILLHHQCFLWFWSHLWLYFPTVKQDLWCFLHFTSYFLHHMCPVACCFHKDLPCLLHRCFMWLWSHLCLYFPSVKQDLWCFLHFAPYFLHHLCLVACCLHKDLLCLLHPASCIQHHLCCMGCQY